MKADNPYQTLLRLGAPVLVTQLGVITVAFADTIMVGRYGVDELAATAFVNSLFMVPIVMLIGLGNGVTPLVGALYSQQEHRRLGRIVRAAVQLNSGIGLLFTLLMGILYFFVDYMGQPPELLELNHEYYLLMLTTLLPSAVFNCCQQTANGTTDTTSPMWIILGANCLNILGNYVLIFGNWGFPELGLLGAGISTATARWLAAIAMVLVIHVAPRYRKYREGMSDKDPCAALRWKVWRTSYPVMIQNGVECFLWSFGAVVCGWFGAVQLAAYQVTNTIGQLGFMIYLSFGVAISIRTANQMGVHDIGGMRQTMRAGLVLIMTLATLSSVTFLFAERLIIPLFTESEEVMASAGALIWPLILYQYCDAAQLAFCNGQRGTSYVKPLLWASLIAYILIGIPVALLLGGGMRLGNVGVYYSFCIALLAAAVLLGYWYYGTLRRLEREYGEE